MHKAIREATSLTNHTLRRERKGVTIELSPRNAIIEHSSKMRC